MVRNGHLSDLIFQSTLSMRRATITRRPMTLSTMSFQSTLSMRRATGESTQSWVLSIFQSTLSMRRATSQFFFNAVKSCDFNPRSP